MDCTILFLFLGFFKAASPFMCAGLMSKVTDVGYHRSCLSLSKHPEHVHVNLTARSLDPSKLNPGRKLFWPWKSRQKMHGSGVEVWSLWSYQQKKIPWIQFSINIHQSPDVSRNRENQFHQSNSQANKHDSLVCCLFITSFHWIQAKEVQSESGQPHMCLAGWALLMSQGHGGNGKL